MFAHRARFVDFQPKTIVSLAVSASNGKLAVLRESGDIEIWNPRKNWYIELVLLFLMVQTVPGVPESSPENVAWIGNRLFTCGLDGYVREWDLVALREKNRLDSHGGGAIWCLAPSFDGSRLAIGCEDGSVRIFDTSDLSYLKTSGKHEGRILSLCWTHDDSTLITGASDGCIRKVNAETGRIEERIVLDKVSGEQTLVWAVLCLKNGTIVSGDSNGKVSFWDWNTNTLTFTAKAHQADVLCLCADSMGETVFSSGIDRVIVQYKHVTLKSHKKWIVAGEKRYHSHDVKAIVLCPEGRATEALVTGGVDAQLIVSSPSVNFPNVKQQRKSPFPQRPILQFHKESRAVSMRTEDTIKVWTLGGIEGHNLDELVDTQKIIPSFPYQLMLELKPLVKSNIVAHAVNSELTFVAVSDAFDLKLFRITNENGITRVRKCGTFNSNGDIPSAHQLLFVPGSKRLLVAGNDSKIYVVDDYDAEEYTVSKVFTPHTGSAEMEIDDSRKNRPITCLVHADKKYFASADLSNVYIYDLRTLELISQVPNFGTITAMAFHKFRKWLLFANTRNEFYIFSFKDNALLPWSQKNSNRIPGKFLEREETVTGVFWESETSFCLHGHTYIAWVDINKPLYPNANIHMKRRNGVEAVQPLHESAKKKKEAPVNLRMTHRFQSVMFASLVSKEELLVVERPTLAMLENLPPSFYKRKYGS